MRIYYSEVLIWSNQEMDCCFCGGEGGDTICHIFCLAAGARRLFRLLNADSGVSDSHRGGAACS